MTQLTNKNYKWDASFYAANSNAQLTWAKEFLEKLNLKPHEHLLDVGCGDGKITAGIAQQLKEGSVTGIDSSEEMIKFAVNSFPKTSYPNLDFMVMDARELKFDKKFDVIFSNAVLHWIIDHRSLLKLMYNALKSKGRILLQMGGKGNCVDVINLVDEVIGSKKWKDYFKDFSFPYGFYGDNEYNEWLTEAGFIIDNVQLIPKDMQHNGKDGLAGWFRSTWLPYLERIPQEQVEEFINEVLESYLKNFPIDSNGKTHVKMMRLQVEAHKS